MIAISDPHVIDRHGSQIHYWLNGPADGPVIALNHGATMDHRLFNPQLDVLTGAGYRVLTWDARGHGRSQPLGRGPISVEQMTDDLVAILDGLGHTGPICIGGQSMGGYIAQDFVRRHPERTAAIVIIGSSCITMPIPWWQQWALHLTPWVFRAWPWEHLKRLVARSTAQRQGVQDYALQAVAQMTKDDFVAIWRGLAHVMQPDPGYRITHPLLLTHGEQDRTGNIAAVAPRWAARDPQCRYRVIPGAGHNANQDNAEFFNLVLSDFLAEHYPPGLDPTDPGGPSDG